MSQYLISFDLGSLNQTEKVKFLYALRGRDRISGIINHYALELIGKNVILCNQSNKDEVLIFFKTWNVPVKIYTVDIKNIMELNYNTESK